MKTDDELGADVRAELKWEPSVDAGEIGVDVADGAVTLAGVVSSYAEKCSAERAAHRVAGVRAVAVEVKVALAESSKRTDAKIARSAQDLLSWTTILPKDAVKVVVENGWITLSGSVDWQYQRLAAVECVRELIGVTGVSDEIVIKPRHSVLKAKLSSRILKADIEAALRRRATENAQAISVDVRGRDVILTGTVSNWAERELATHSAWSAAGVSSVVDHLTIPR